jgi:hypothetical protein
MRMMMQFWIPVEAGNEAARTGAFGQSFQKILDGLSPRPPTSLRARRASAADTLCLI